MKICLINPSNIQRSEHASALSSDNKYFINATNIPHIGLGYIASYLEQHGFSVDIIECAHSSFTPEQVCEKVVAGDYDAVGISIYYFNYKNALKILLKIREKLPNLFIYAGGYLATMCPEMLLQELEMVRCCIIGEGEITTLELLYCLQKNECFENIPGIAYWRGNEIVKTKKRELIADLDVLPFPKRSFVSNRKIANVLSTRGCYGACTYCGIQEFFQTCSGEKVRRRSPENVIEEVEQLLANEDLDYIGFNDGNFNIAGKKGKEWYERFRKLTREKNIKIKFLVDFRANEIVNNEKIIKDFIEIGLYNVNIGIESFTQRQLDFYNKKVKAEDNIKAIQIIESLKLKYTYGMLLFDPIVTVDEIYENLVIIRDIGIYHDNYTINPPLSLACTVIATKGTALYDYVAENNLFVNNDRNYRFLHEETELCHNITEEWSRKIAPIFHKSYIAYIAEEHGFSEELNEIKNIYRDLFFLDLNVFTKIALEIKNGDIEEDRLHGMLMENDNFVNELRLKADNLEKQMMKFY